MNINKKNIGKAIVILGVFSLIMPLFVSASGIISQSIEIEDAMRGQEVEELLSLVNTSDSEIVFKLSAEGDIADWVSYKQSGDIERLITEITALSEEWAKARVFIRIPDDTPNGEYNGSLVALISPSSSEGDEGEFVVGIAQKFDRPVKIVVTDEEIVDFKATVMPEKYVVKKNTPLKIKMIYTNNGNIAIRPNAQVKIFDSSEKEIFNVIYPYPEMEAPVRPRATKVIEVVRNTDDLKQGKYRVEAIITLNGEEKHRDQFFFTLNNTGFWGGIVKGASDMNSWVYLIALAVIVSILVIIIRIVRVYIQKNNPKKKVQSAN